jgi:hypothetical protein
MLQALNVASISLIGLPDITAPEITQNFANACNAKVDKLEQSAFIITADIVKRSKRMLDFFNMHKLVLSSYPVDATGTFDEAFTKICEARPHQTTISAHFSTLATKTLRFMKRAFEVSISQFNASKLSANNLSCEEALDIFTRLANLELGVISSKKNPKNNLSVTTFTRVSSTTIRSRPDLGQLLMDMGLNLTTVLATLAETEAKEAAEALKRAREGGDESLPDPKRQKIRRSVPVTSTVIRKDNELPYERISMSYEDAYVPRSSDSSNSTRNSISERINPQYLHYRTSDEEIEMAKFTISKIHYQNSGAEYSSGHSSQNGESPEKTQQPRRSRSMKRIEHTRRTSKCRMAKHATTTTQRHSMLTRSRSNSRESLQCLPITNKREHKKKLPVQTKTDSENEIEFSDSGHSSKRSSIESSNDVISNNNNNKQAHNIKTKKQSASIQYNTEQRQMNDHSSEDETHFRPTRDSKLTNIKQNSKSKHLNYDFSSDSENDQQLPQVSGKLPVVKFPVKTMYQKVNSSQAQYNSNGSNNDISNTEISQNSIANSSQSKAKTQKNGRYGPRGPYKKTLLKAALNNSIDNEATASQASVKPAKKRRSHSPDGKNVETREKSSFRTKNFTPPPHQEPAQQLHRKQSQKVSSRMSTSDDM